MTRKTIIVFTLCCLLIELAHNLLFSAFTVAIYSGMGLHDWHLTPTGIAGCLTESWMVLTRTLILLILNFIVISSGYWISKKALSDATRIAGSLLFYAFIRGMVIQITNAIAFHHIPFLYYLDHERWSTIPIVFFGNFYVFKVFHAVLYYATTLLFSFWAYRIVFKYWPLAFRKMVFTWGLAACAMGWIIWYLWLGPLIF
ncbi:MAG: hypothetical protein WC760_07940 [Bacteroidia bacterium]|jgi:hypothetical protein